MKRLNIILGVISQPPRGLDPRFYEGSYQRALRPFLKTLNEFPDFPVSLFFSGTQLEWLGTEHPEAIMLIGDMVKRRQVEMIGGGYYDPIFPIVSSSDRVGQVEMLTTLIRKKFGKRPRGGWITDGVWEPNLPIFLRNSGLNYVFLGSDSFVTIGLSDKELLQPYLTEEQGKVIKVFPLSNEISEFLQTATPEAAVNKLRALRKRYGTGTAGTTEMTLSVFVDIDHPGADFTSRDDRNGKDQWWLSLFSLLEKRKEFALQLPGSVHLATSQVRKIYLSGYEVPRSHDVTGVMLPELQRSRGIFRNNFDQYSELNLFYAKMLHVSALVDGIKRDRSRKKSARREIWCSQSKGNYSYNVFEALHYRSIRLSGWRALLEAERITREKGIFQPGLVKLDFDMDGVEEFLYQGNALNVYIHSVGAQVFELDHLSGFWNYQDTYCHWKRTKVERNSFVDSFIHLSSGDGTSKDRNPFSLGGHLFEKVLFDKERKRVGFEGEVDVPDITGIPTSIYMTKHYTLLDYGFRLSYNLTNLEDTSREILIATTVNLALPSLKGDEVKIRSHSRGRVVERSEGSLKSVKMLQIQDNPNRAYLELEASKLCDMRLTANEVFDTYSDSSIYQSTSAELSWRKRIASQKTWGVDVEFRLERIPRGVNPSTTP